MPYVKQEKRDQLKYLLREMKEEEIVANGDLNYLLYAYCVHHIPKSYNTLKNYCGELRQCATEIERRILAQYENEKIEENGDII